jgi:hypothetical protein
VFTTETQSTQSKISKFEFRNSNFLTLRAPRLRGESSEPFVAFVIFVVSKYFVKA